MDSAVVLLRVVLALGCVLGLIWYAGRKLSRTPGARGAKSMPMTVIGRQSLGKSSGIALVEVAGRVLLLGIGEQGVRVLTEIDQPTATVVTVAPADVPGLVPDGLELREELDLVALTDLNGADAGPARLQTAGSARLASLAQLAGLAAGSSAREAGIVHGSILSPTTWRRAVDAVQQRTVRR